MVDDHLEEWKVARDALKEFDTRLHDLSKFGFSFLTALLAAESILVPRTLAEGPNPDALPGFVRFCILMVTLIFIVTIGLIERNYQLFLKAINQRAVVLERILNFELSETITFRYKVGRGRFFRYFVYFAYVAVIVMLGYAILMPEDPLLFLALFVSSALATALIIGVLEFSNLVYRHGKVDWSLGRIQCHKHDFVTITITNLSPARRRWWNGGWFGEELRLPKGTLFKVKSLDGPVVYEHKLETPITVKPEGTYSGVWKTGDSPYGMYQVFPGDLERIPDPDREISEKGTDPENVISWSGQALNRMIVVTERPK